MSHGLIVCVENEGNTKKIMLVYNILIVIILFGKKIVNTF